MVHKFVIERNSVLRHQTSAFYSLDYVGWHNPNNPDFINDLKNTFDKESDITLMPAIAELERVLDRDLTRIVNSIGMDKLTICCIPRAKARNTYSSDQLLFMTTIKKWVRRTNRSFYIVPELIDGTDYIIRHTNTRTTHLSRSGFDQDGDLPYKGITKDTCNISPNVSGSDILLIDDIYTKSVNIDEDAIQALYDKGANSVTFYAVARTVAH